MITLPITTKDALLKVDPFYTIAAGTDVTLTFDFSEAWANVNPVAIFTRYRDREEIPIEGGAVRVPLKFVEPSHFSVCVEDRVNDEVRMTSTILDVYVAPTIKGETWQ